MKSAKILTALVAVALVASLFVMAGAPMSVRADDPTQTPAPTATFVPVSEGTLTIWVDKDRSLMIEKVGAAFTKKYNVPVQVQQMGFGDIRNNMVLAAPAGEGADIGIGAHDWLGQLVANGVVAEVDLGDKAKSIDPVALNAWSYGGKLYGLPYQTEAIALIYNPDLVATPPTTWDELVKVAKQLIADKKVDVGLAFGGEGDPYHHYPIFTSFGGYVFGANKDGSYNPQDVGLDNDGALKGAAFLAQMIKDGVVKTGVDYNTAKDLFVKGKMPFWVSGPWNLADFRKGNVKFAVAKIPAGDKAAMPFVGSQGFFVNKFSKNLALAQAFLTEFVATDEGAQLLYDAVPAIPAWLPLKSKLSDKDLAGFGLSAADGQPMPAIPEMAAVWTAWGNAVTLIEQQKGDSAQIMKDAAKAVRDEIAKKK